MKALLLGLVMATGIVSVTMAQQHGQDLENEDVPKVVYNAFGEKYPEASVVKWYYPDCNCYEDWVSKWEEEIREGEDYKAEMEQPDFFQVAYKYKDKNQRTIYYRNGEWVESRSKIRREELPETIKQAVEKTQYRNWDIGKYVVLVEKPRADGKTEMIYRLYMKGGLKRHLLKFYPDGTLVPKKRWLTES